MRPEIDIVIPVFNEADGIESSVAEILRVIDLGTLGKTVRLILVDDGSSDASYDAIRRLVERDARIASLRLTRNFGKEAAIEAGLTYSAGDAVVVMDSDLQHPPELLPQFVEEWRRGALVVEGVKRSRGAESWFARVFARVFYRTFGLLSKIPIDNHTDFKLLDRKIVDIYLQLPERRKFFRGLVLWMGHSAKRVPFDVPERAAGRSSWPRVRLLHYAWDNICSFSATPLRLMGVLGAIAIAIAIALLVISIVQYVRGTAEGGFTTVIFLIVFLSGIQLVAIGVLGSFVARVYDELKQRPLFLVSETRRLDIPAPDVRPRASG